MELVNINDTEPGQGAFLEGWEDAAETQEAESAPQEPEAEEPDRSEQRAAAGILAGAGLATPSRRRMTEADMRTFVDAFPEAARDPGSIPPPVWDMVRSGRGLTASYAAYRSIVSQAPRRNAENAARSSGSMRSAGAGFGPGDPFLEGWNE